MQHLQISSLKISRLIFPCRVAPALCLLILTAAPLPLARATRSTPVAAAQQQQQPAQDVHVHPKQTPEPERFTRTVEPYTPPDVTLLDMDGRKVALASALGREGAVMLQFIFTTCPAVCPVMSATFSAAQGRLGAAELKKVRMISVSVDPEQDTPPRLREYARKFKAGSQWLFLTGDPDDIATLRKSFDAYSNNKMRHQPLTFLRAAPGKPWVRLDGLMSATQLLAEYKRLVAE